jgi:endonuclease/exonuclease/phosphatase (EEP) superfamily protein YafD
VTWLLILIALSITIATLAGFAGAAWWVLDVLAHFRVPYALAAGLLTLAFAWQRRRGWIAIMALCLAANLAVMGPYLPFARGVRAAKILPAPPAIRAIAMNVWHRNRNYAAAERLIRSARPDFVLTVEMTPAWRRGLASLSDILPYAITATHDGTAGKVLYSRYRCVRCEVVDIGGVGLPTIVAEFRVGDRNLTFVGAHFTVPLGSAYAHLMAKHIAAVGEYVRARSGPVVLLGDLNTTPWSHYFRDLRDRSGLRDSALGRGVQPTWPAWWRVPVVAIDHVLVTQDIRIVNREVGPSIGSDHLPVIVDFTYTYPRRRGSSTSLNQSPTRFRLSTSVVIARPGNNGMYG